MEFSNRLVQQWQVFWSTLPPKQRAALGISMVLLVAGFAGLMLWLNQVNYVPLFAQVDPQSMATIVESLEKKKVPYELINDGNGIAVPSERVHRMRLALASEGVVGDGKEGWNIFDSMPLTTSNSGEKLRFVRALQGELSKTINQLEPVMDSRVHLVIPSKQLFTSQQEPTTAAVYLQLHPGQSLDKSQVRAIVNLLASSVEGLRAENVTVVDKGGRLLTAARTDPNTMAPSTLIEYQDAIEQKYSSRIREMLEPVLGVGKVLITVQASVQLASVETSSESYNPDNRVVRSEQTRSEIRTNAPGEASGVPGTAANLPENQLANSSASSGATIKKDESVVNAEIDTTKTRTIQPPGELKRVSVSVLVDGTYDETAAPPAEGAATEPKYVPRKPEELAEIERMVKGAIGFTASRGDTVEISNMKFQTAPQEFEGSSLPVPVEKIVQYALMGLAILLLFVLLRPILRALTIPPPVKVSEVVSEAPSMLTEPSDTLLLPGVDKLRLLTAGVPNQERERRDAMIRLVQSDIDNTVDTIREWLR